MPPSSSDSPRKEHADHAGKRSGDRTGDEIRIGWRMGAIGFEVASEAVAGLLLGLAIDAIFGTGKRWTIIGAITGIAVGLWSLIRRSLQLNRELDRTSPAGGRGKPISDEDWQSWDTDTSEDEDKTDSA